MEKKKGLVFDSQSYFGRFLKYEFKHDFVFDSYKSIEHFDDSLEGYNVIVFMIYNDDEMIDMIQLYRRGVPLILCSLDTEMKQKLEKIKDVVHFDCAKVKSEMRLELLHYINLIV
ncbi:hypothetical protein Flavo103_26380 [Flavobacterium collinsii]|uniref:hypothetical protein n=1 Tax=Flavobacterium collinsii TaxID=1114861 RepID=UPI0022C8F72A|nr:hypothetical protein [Flavobacterium collinsii]GIQ59502.1 hypothetical protein Flavo103_26380 [Flavobacterium collinsii]